MDLHHPLFESPLFHHVDADGLLERWPIQQLEPGQHLLLTPGQLLYVARGCVGLARGLGGPVRSVLWSPRFHLTRHPMELHALGASAIAVFPFEQLADFAGPGWLDWKARLMQAVLQERSTQHRQHINRLGATWWRHHPVDRSRMGRRCAQPHRVRLELWGLPLGEGRIFLAGRVRDLTWSQQSTEPTHDLALVLRATAEGLLVEAGWAEDLEALVHGRRRYGLPLRYGLVETHPQRRGHWAVVAAGRPQAWLQASPVGHSAWPGFLEGVPSRLISRGVDRSQGRERRLLLELPDLKLRACSVYAWHDLARTLGGSRRQGFHLDQELELGHARWEAP